MQTCLPELFAPEEGTGSSVGVSLWPLLLPGHLPKPSSAPNPVDSLPLWQGLPPERDSPASQTTQFWLGTDEPAWLGRTDVPLFLSRRRLARLRHPPRARGPWALDSGGFSELSLYGRWAITARQYAREVTGWLECPGRLAWAATMDWPCEPEVLGRTGLAVREHLERTVANYLELVGLCPWVPWVPVLQGWGYDDYWHCLTLYERAGVDLAALPLVGLGSVCRRQQTALAEELIRHLAAEGIALHVFGFKVSGLARVAGVLRSADSMAWSYRARKRPPLPGCLHFRCNHCLRYALAWRIRVLEAIRRGQRRRVAPTLFG